jgi:hypothetical protein
LLIRIPGVNVAQADRQQAVFITSEIPPASKANHGEPDVLQALTSAVQRRRRQDLPLE